MPAVIYHISLEMGRKGIALMEIFDKEIISLETGMFWVFNIDPLL